MNFYAAAMDLALSKALEQLPPEKRQIILDDMDVILHTRDKESKIEMIRGRLGEDGIVDFYCVAVKRRGERVPTRKIERAITLNDG